MRLLPLAALSLALAGACAWPAGAIDVEVLAPRVLPSAVPSAEQAAAPAAPATPTAAGQPPAAPIETGSVEKSGDAPTVAPAATELPPAASVSAAPVSEAGSVETNAAATAAAPASEPLPASTAAAAPAEPPAALQAPVSETPATETSAVGRGVRDALAAEAAATAPPPPLADGEKPPPRSPEQRDRDALAAFYQSRNDEPVWVSAKGLNARAIAVIDEMKRAGEWGLDASTFALPSLRDEATTATGDEPAHDDLVKAEIALSLAVLEYHLHARGGVIYDAPKQLSSYLDRRPQLRDRKVFLDEIAKAENPAQYLAGLHPRHPEFERLRQAWLAAKKGKGAKGKASTEQLLANMQQWRWMPEELGEFYVWLNVPEYTIRLVKDGEVVFTERVTVGLVNKQTPIFSDQIERVTFKSRWRVPDSIKVKEVWPSLLSGGGMMRQHGLIMMKGEEEVDWRSIDWTKADMNDYTLWQPPGPKNQLGLVKFSFPNKHYVFMHDTPDKYMFAWNRRANSHGCMRIRNPLAMAAHILSRDKGWDRAKIDDLVANGPEHNIVELEKKVPVHITYLTARIDEAGKIQTFHDIYGHEKRVRQALGGAWDKIATGPDHLAPLDQTRAPRVVASSARKNRALREPRTLTELMFGGN